ncbi:hypothetical protein N656DRAFT_386797 [Canariomyces notabilis]|uniref:Secreted protein n=1 Tax=Canariomyces notabilis TaxID=2074819 RepID=A0AAN6TJP1_9PEZI|nr:hypothetical protein N656DRAFT_386797 [Canariomyces arenarius]
MSVFVLWPLTSTPGAECLNPESHPCKSGSHRLRCLSAPFNTKVAPYHCPMARSNLAVSVYRKPYTRFAVAAESKSIPIRSPHGRFAVRLTT